VFNHKGIISYNKKYGQLMKNRLFDLIFFIADLSFLVFYLDFFYFAFPFNLKI